MSFLAVRGLSRRFGSVPAVDGVDLDVAAGSRTAIVGPSGCGKTTLLRLIAGFDAADAGEIRLDGRTLAQPGETVPAHQRGIGVVAQDGALFPHLTIAENIGFGIHAREPRRAQRIAELAYTVGLNAGILRRQPHELSGGQQQRVALARAMAKKPALMLLDEPFSALDTGLRASMRKAVAELLETAGIATILVTHDQTEALSFADQVAVMREGRLAQVGPPRDLYFRPVDRMVAEFLGDALILPASVAGGIAQTPIGPLAVDSSARRDVARVMLRPEQLVLEALPAGASHPAETPGDLFGEITASEFAGAASTLAVRLLNRPDAPGAAAIGSEPLILRRPSLEAPAVGAVVRITVRGGAHLFP